MTGLIIGSLTPDFEYFLRMRIQSDYSHTISGLFWFDIPLGILLAFLFHNVVRDRLFDNLPFTFKSRLAKYKLFDWNRYFKSNFFVVAASILIGAASHIFWDSFTHDTGYFVQSIPALTSEISFFGRHVPILKILQHLSTLLGCLVIFLALYTLPPDKNVTGQVSVKYWVVIFVITSAIVLARLLTGLDIKLYGHFIVTTISAGLISLTLTPWLTRKRE